MPTEPFLINPYRVPRRRFTRPVLDIERRYYPRKREVFRNSAMVLNEPSRLRALSGYRRVLGRNPLGEEVMIVGANPRRRKRRRERREGRLETVRASRIRRRRVSRRRRPRKGFFARLFGLNPRREMLTRRRRYRSNPPRAASAELPAFSLANPEKFIMPAAVATAGFLAADRAPSMINVTGTLPRFGVKFAVVVGGGLLISRFLGKANGVVWSIGSSVNLLSDILKTYVFKTTLAGFSAYPTVPGITYESGMGAYPAEYEFAGYPT